ncbi:MAG: hypothetical protein LBH24_05710 [Clostridiales bacterium]|jgi:hypothetical protein|nr:hypothetical protein [Clostridiales bacterium]
MKRGKIVSVCLGLLVLCLAVSACHDPEQRDYTLSFDGDSAYFKSSVALLPIRGDAPEGTDVYESAAITLSAAPAARLRLAVAFEAGQQAVLGLRIAVNGTAYEFSDGAVVYESADEITGVTLDVRIYLDKNTPISEKNKRLAFQFVMGAL